MREIKIYGRIVNDLADYRSWIYSIVKCEFPNGRNRLESNNFDLNIFEQKIKYYYKKGTSPRVAACNCVLAAEYKGEVF